MRRVVALFIVIAALVSLAPVTGCSTDDKPKSAPTTPQVVDDCPFDPKQWRGDPRCVEPNCNAERAVLTPGGSLIHFSIKGKEKPENICRVRPETVLVFDPETEYSGDEADEETDAIIVALWHYSGLNPLLRQIQQFVKGRNKQHAKAIRTNRRWADIRLKARMVPPPASSAPAPTGSRPNGKASPSATASPTSGSGNGGSTTQPVPTARRTSKPKK